MKSSRGCPSNPDFGISRRLRPKHSSSKPSCGSTKVSLPRPIHQVALGTILPVVAVRKSGGGYRFALDLRAINAKIKRPDFAHLLDVTYITRKASEFRVLGRLDCTAAFLNVELSKALQQHCHYRVGNNLYRFLRMPFGLKTATGHWQRFLSLLLHEIDPSVTSKAEWWPTSRSMWMTL